MKDYEKLFERFKFYHYVHHNADVPKIANLANEEKIISGLVIIKQGGLDFLKHQINKISDSIMLTSLLVIIGPYDQPYSIERYQEMIKKKDTYVLACEPYGLKNMLDSEFHKKNMEYYNKLLSKSKISNTAA